MLFTACAQLLLWVAFLGIQAEQLNGFQSCKNFYSLSLACSDLSGDSVTCYIRSRRHSYCWYNGEMTSCLFSDPKAIILKAPLHLHPTVPPLPIPCFGECTTICPLVLVGNPEFTPPTQMGHQVSPSPSGVSSLTSISPGGEPTLASMIALASELVFLLSGTFHLYTVFVLQAQNENPIFFKNPPVRGTTASQVKRRPSCTIQGPSYFSGLISYHSPLTGKLQTY